MNHPTVRRPARAGGFTMLELLVVIVIMCILMLVAIPAISKFRENAREANAAASSSAAQTTTAPADDASDDETVGTVVNRPSSIPFGTIFAFIGITAAGVLLVSGSSYGVVRVRRARRLNLTERQLLESQWEKAKARHAKLREESYEVESGVLARVDWPALFDYDDAATRRWINAAAAATDLELESVPLHSPDRVAAYETAVREAEAAWEAAYTNARRISLSKLPFEDRQKVAKARKLLERVLDDAATDAERRLAYTKAVGLLEGIMDVPEKVRLRLEASSRLQLTAGKQTVSLGK